MRAGLEGHASLGIFEERGMLVIRLFNSDRSPILDIGPIDAIAAHSIAVELGAAALKLAKKQGIQ